MFLISLYVVSCSARGSCVRPAFAAAVRGSSVNPQAFALLPAGCCIVADVGTFNAAPCCPADRVAPRRLLCMQAANSCRPDRLQCPADSSALLSDIVGASAALRGSRAGCAGFVRCAVKISCATRAPCAACALCARRCRRLPAGKQ